MFTNKSVFRSLIVLFVAVLMLALAGTVLASPVQPASPARYTPAPPTESPEPTVTPAPTELPLEVPTSLPTEIPMVTEADDINALAVTYYVKASGGSDSNSCLSPGAACATINAAIGKAADGDTIRVATGTYTGTGTGTEVVLIDKSATLSGGWNTTFTTQSGTSTIDGEGTRSGIKVVELITATVDRFTVQNGPFGGIENQGILTINNSIIRNNMNESFAGGILNGNDSVLTLNNTEISNNSAGLGGSGGLVNWGTAIINNSTISGNSTLSTSSGSGISNSGSFTLNNTTVSGNTGSYSIETITHSFTINNSTLSGNTEGGILNYGSEIMLNNSTITGNLYGILNVSEYSGTVIMKNSVLANNTNFDCKGPIISSGYNLIGNNAWCEFTPSAGDLVGTGANPINPQLGPLQDNGGSTFTHALLSNSPAIDAGNPASSGSGGNACLTTDQRGTTRPLGSACDIGAYESSFSAVHISGNAGIAGATLSYTNGSPLATTADGSGNYSIAVPSGWSGTVTPAKSDYIFSPTNRTYTNVLTDQMQQNYSATAYPIISGNAGLGGATLSYTNGILQTVIADGSGNYSITVPPGWSGTITPSKTGYIFAPVNRPYQNVISNQTAQNYTASISLSSLIKDPSFEANPPNPYWSEYSYQFGTPLCIVTNCGNGGGTAGPHSGSVWGWFGGTSYDEAALLSQTVNIPSGHPNLRLLFYFWIGAAAPGSDTADVFWVQIDNVTVFSANATQQSSYPTYTPIIVDISAFANGASHTITFSSVTTGQVVNFNLDDVSLADAAGTATLVSPSGFIDTNYNPIYTWNEASDTTWYYLYVNGPSGNVIRTWYEASAICNAGICSVTPSTTLGGGNHTWWVQTYNALGNGPWSSEMTFNTYIQPLPGTATLIMPTGAIGTNYTPTYTWNQASDATWYYLYVNGPSGNVIKEWYTSAQANCNGTICSITPTTTLGGGNHTWWVQTYNSTGYGPWSAGQVFNTFVETPPLPVTTFTAPLGNINTHYNPDYIWTAIGNATWYELYIDGPSGKLLDAWYPASICNTGVCTVTNSLTLGGGNHTWWVRTWNSAGYGNWSAGQAFNTFVETPPLPVTSFTAPLGSITTDYTPDFKWGSISNATWYELYISGPSGKVLDAWFEASVYCSAGTCTVLHPVTLGGGNHTWWVRTWNSAGYGNWSIGNNFSTAPLGTATLVSPTGSSGSNPPVYTWNMVTGSTWYYVWVDGSSGNVLKQWYDAALVCGASTCSVTQPSSLANGSYNWWVQTWNSAGYGPWSGGRNFSIP